MSQAFRQEMREILAGVAHRKSAEALRRKRWGDGSGRRHLDLLRAALARRVQVIIWGRHSPDWMDALAPSSPIWQELDLVGDVVHVDADEGALAGVLQADLYPVLLPLMENHARQVPATHACPSPESGPIELLADKGLFAAFLSESGLDRFAPHTYQSLDGVSYPCVIKPTTLNAGVGIHVVRDRMQLDQIATELCAGDQRFIIQSCIDGSDEYVTHAVIDGDAILWDTTFHYAMGGENVIRGADITGEYSIARIQTPQALRRILCRIGKTLGYTGAVNVDYKMIGGRPQIFEINPRLGGSLMRPDNADALREALRAVVDCAVASDRFFASIVRKSTCFDASFYMKSSNEFERRPHDPALHYFCEGSVQGRDPCPSFSSTDYAAINLSGEMVGLNALVHFELCGKDRRLATRRRERANLNSALARLDDWQPGQKKRQLRRIAVGERGWPVLNAMQDGFRKLFDLGGRPSPETVVDRARKSPFAELPQTRRGQLHRMSGAEAQRLIADRGLRTVNDSWHYSWDMDRFFPQAYLYETSTNSYVFHKNPIPYISAPAPLFSDDRNISRIVSHAGRFFPYWFLKLGSFDEFLRRRSLSSTKPGANFPTCETYGRMARKKRCSVRRLPLRGNEDVFVEQFSRWKDPAFSFDGNACLRFYRSVNPLVPYEWFYVYLLMDEISGSGRGVMLTIEDGQSSAMLNLANQPGDGLWMVVEAVRLMASMSYASVNSGVSGFHGHYKDVIYLDRMMTDATGFLPLGSGTG